ncbi:protein kinase domain-containing protein [Lachnospiraceae bacterium HCP1S3_C3]
MIDTRQALESNYEIHFENKIFKISGEIGRGANCIVYDASTTDSAGTVHNVRIKECYPCNLSIAREDGELKLAEEDIDRYSLSKERFIQAYKNNVSFRGMSGIINSTVNSTDIFESNNTIYTVMSMDEGICYSDYTDSSLKEVLEHVKTLAGLIKKYHDNGYLHMDIKPDNIFILPETTEHILLFDFETVRKLEDIKSGKVQMLEFTKGFSAPEQMYGQTGKIGKCTDIYSVGAVLFSKIFGRNAESGDGELFAEYDFENMLYKDKMYQPKLYRLLDIFFRKTLAISPVLRYKDMQQVTEAVDELIKAADIDGTYLIDSFQYNSANFVGRDDELEEINDILEENQLVFLSGIGGIGKTELAKRYVKQYRSRYNTAIFSVFESSIRSLVCDDIRINRLDRDEDETEEDYFRRKIEALKNVATKDDIIIIDNFDVDYDESLEILFSCPCKFIITTRMDFRDYNYEQIMVDRISNPDDVLSLFYAYNDTPYSDDEYESVMKLFEYIDYHTMTVELIAKYLRNSNESPTVLYERFLEKAGTANTDETGVKQRKDMKLRLDSVNNHISVLFDISKFDDGAREVMAGLSLFAGIRIKKELFCRICGVADAEQKIEYLIKNGWIQYNEVTEKISLHQVIQDMIYRKICPDASKYPAIANGMYNYMIEKPNGYTERLVRQKVSDIFMDRISGDNLDYAKLCLAYGAYDKLDEAESICIRSDDREAYNILAKVYMKKVKLLAASDDIRNAKDFDKNVIGILNLMAEMFDKAVSCCEKYSDDSDYLTEEYLDIGFEMDSILNYYFFGGIHNPVKEMDDIYNKIIEIFDKAMEMIQVTSFDDKRKIDIYEKMQNFYSPDDYTAIYRSDNFSDIEKAYMYEEMIDEINEKNYVPNDNCINVIVKKLALGDVAEQHEINGEYETAIEYYRRAYDAGEESYTLMLESISDVYVKMGDEDSAISCLEKIFETEVLDSACVKLIKLFIRRKEYDKVRKYANILLEDKIKSYEKNPENKYLVEDIILAYYELYYIEENDRKKEQLWENCLKYYDYYGDEDINDELNEFIIEYVDREEINYREIINILERIHMSCCSDTVEQVIKHAIKRYEGREDFKEYHIILLTKYARMIDVYPYDRIKESYKYCDKAQEIYDESCINDEYFQSLIYKTRSEIMSNDNDCSYDDGIELKEKCNYILIAEQRGKYEDCTLEDIIDEWDNSARMYDYMDKYNEQIICLIHKKDYIEESLNKYDYTEFDNDYTNAMDDLIRAYIKVYDFEEAEKCIEILYEKMVDYLMENIPEREYDTEMRMFKVKNIAESYIDMEKYEGAAKFTLLSMYVGLAETIERSILELNGDDSITKLCEVDSELLDRDIDDSLIDTFIDLKDMLIECKENAESECDGIGEIIEKIEGKYQYSDVEFKGEI